MKSVLMVTLLSIFITGCARTHHEKPLSHALLEHYGQPLIIAPYDPNDPNPTISAHRGWTRIMSCSDLTQSTVDYLRADCLSSCGEGEIPVLLARYTWFGNSCTVTITCSCTEPEGASDLGEVLTLDGS